jgi:hypothetical protein
MLACTVLMVCCPSAAHAASHIWYVSRSGDGTTGANWTHAWNELSHIAWSKVKPGDTVLIDGGATKCRSEYHFAGTRPGVDCGMVYQTSLSIGTSGTADAKVHLRLATGAGHNGTAVLFGGRATPLPYCHQTNYTYTAGNSTEITIGNRAYVTIDGTHRSGIMVYGARQGVHFTADGANHITLRNMEIFDNGTASKSSQGGKSWRTDQEGVAIRGSYLVLDRDLVHDNGQDEFQSDDSVARGSIHNLRWSNDWIYAARENPRHTGEPFNDLQAVGSNDCTHADGIQLDGGGAQSSLTLRYDVFGPLLNQGFYPSESSNHTKFDNVVISATTFDDLVSHPILSDLPVHGWTLRHDTFFQTEGGFEIPGDNGTMTMSNTVKQGGYVDMSHWPAAAVSSSMWYLGDSVPGATRTDPQFASIPTAKRPSYSALRNVDLTPTCTTCGRIGSPLTSIDALKARIDQLNAG